MKNIVLFFSSLFIFNILPAQLSLDDIQYWIGSGPDSAALVVDFQDGSTDPSYIWGYLFDASSTPTPQDMLMSISLDEPTLDIAAGGGFLNDIIYNSHSGIVGAPNFWGTWTLNDIGEWELNSGLSENLNNGMIFGCSYTDFDPELPPTTPINAYSSLWFTPDDIEYWIGEGENAAVFVIDFVDDLDYGLPVRYAWGYHFDGEVTAEQMLNDISAMDINLTFDLSGGFLNDIIYIDQTGIAGDPHYWGTFSGTNLSNWTLNTGISEIINDGSWFGCSYAEWEPPRPLTPLSAIDPDSFLHSDVTNWFGSGTDSSVVIIDFNDGTFVDSYAFGYLFNEFSTGQEALITIENAIGDLDINIAGGFLNDISFNAHSGTGGSPNYWATWSATNVGGWALNTGITEIIANGDWFGCSYTDFNPAQPPSNPLNPVLSVPSKELIEIALYPNPTTGTIYYETSSLTVEHGSIHDIYGKLITYIDLNTGINKIDLPNLSPGIYIFRYNDGLKLRQQKLTVKQ